MPDNIVSQQRHSLWPRISLRRLVLGLLVNITSLTLIILILRGMVTKYQREKASWGEIPNDSVWRPEGCSLDADCVYITHFFATPKGTSQQHG